MGTGRCVGRIGIARFENAIDDALIDGSNLIACMLQARQDARLAASVGHEALERIAAAQALLLEALRAVLEGHEELDTVRRRLGLPERADGGKLPTQNPGDLLVAGQIGSEKGYVVGPGTRVDLVRR